MANFAERVARYLRTIRWLRVSQLYWFVVRRFLPASNPAPVAVEATRAPLTHVSLPKIIQPATEEFCFIGITQPISLPVDWHPESMPRLWRYNLHYFDFLLWDVVADTTKAALINDWIEANPVGTVDAWEPYTVSLRVVNWAKYFDALKGAVPETWCESLINQANWLAANLEYHILANHFLKNAKALVYAGALFNGKRGVHFLATGLADFEQEVNEQILSDGGHYERSVMYHGIVLEDLLDIVNLAQAQPALFPQSFVECISNAALAAARFLEDLLHGDGDIALFNDAAFGIAPLPPELVAYAERAVAYERAPRPQVPLIINKADSGYFGYRAGGDSFIIDCGNMAPDYQPGHGHCDMLSYELCLDGRRIVVDSGTYGYETDERRSYLRGTAAHNTLEVNGQNQSEVWGVFRVARRARPVEPRVEDFTSTGMIFEGAHDGYRRLSQKVDHIRRVTIEFGRSWRIKDTLRGKGEVAVRSYIHLAPGLELQAESANSWLVLEGAAVLLTIALDDGCNAAVVETEYFPRFGVAEASQTLVIATRGELPLETGYSLQRFVAKSLT